MAYDKPTVYDWMSDYGPHNKNQTLQDELWESLRISPGVVALSDDFARSKGLHLSQRFPWDENYGIYFISGYHKLHCLVCLTTHPFLSRRKNLHNIAEEDPSLDRNHRAWHSQD